MPKRVLVTGGAGYVGSVLVNELLNESFEVTVLDNLLFDNGSSIINHFKNSNFKFVKGDIRNEPLLKTLVRDKDAIVHLAAIVGFPACSKDPFLAKSVNLDASKLISRLLSKDQLLIFSSTGSNYGHVKSGICTEETELHPLSLYGRTKTESEKVFLDNNSSIVYRFATAFGLSPRMRLDLLINDFVNQAMINKSLIMFEKHFKRTFIHVDDMCKSILFALKNYDRMIGQAYNIGGEQNNLTKWEIAELIKEQVDYYLHFADIFEDVDKRNYIVSYKKINDLGFSIERTVKQGIDELVRAHPILDKRNYFKNA